MATDYGEEIVPARNTGIIPATSLVICSRNRAQMLQDTVVSILAGYEVPSEIVIVDQSDTKNADLLATVSGVASSVHYHHVDDVGVSRARNASLHIASFDMIVFTDDDVMVAPEWFGAIVRALQAGGPECVVTGQVLPHREPTRTGRSPSTITDSAPAVYEGLITQDVLYTGNMALYRSAFLAVAGFDERFGGGARFPAAEDNDFGFRLLTLGYRIVYEPAAVLYHRAWRSKAAAFRLAWSYGRGQGAFYAKYVRSHRRVMHRRLRDEVLRRGRRLPRRVLEHGWEALSDVPYMLGMLVGFGEWMLRERQA
jgi:GT2 family glycosyltransferase